MDQYHAILLAIGVLALAAVLLPAGLRRRMISAPLVLVAAGAAVYGLPAVDAPGPFGEGAGITERLAELAVILALTGAGLRIDRPVGWRAWTSTWRLLAVAMPLSIAAAALLGWWAVGLAPATALLFGAVFAPTDPVLAGDVQTGPPGRGTAFGENEEDEVRFALTSESGLNDGLAFPFTNAAIAMAAAGGEAGGWVADWLLIDVLWRVSGGIAAGWLVGRALGWLVVRLDEAARPVTGLLALAMTLISYGVAESLRAYGFLAVFVCAVAVRDVERDHRIHATLHAAVDQYEHLAMAVVMVLFGGALVNGILAPVTVPMVVVSVLLLVVVRPVAAGLGLLGAPGSRAERTAIAVFGIRGLGSVYYLAHGLNEAAFPQAERLWALASLTILLSLVGHGLAARPALARLDRRVRPSS